MLLAVLSGALHCNAVLLVGYISVILSFPSNSQNQLPCSETGERCMLLLLLKVKILWKLRFGQNLTWKLFWYRKDLLASQCSVLSPVWPSCVALRIFADVHRCLGEAHERLGAKSSQVPIWTEQIHSHNYFTEGKEKPVGPQECLCPHLFPNGPKGVCSSGFESLTNHQHFRKQTLCQV